MKTGKPQTWIVAIAVTVMIVLSLITAPTHSELRRGSTFNRAPDGYGAWYAFIEQQGVQRWQSPFRDLLKTPPDSPITLIQINSQLSARELDSSEQEWVNQGNTLIRLGVEQPVTQAPFSTWQLSPAGKVKIDTRRRAPTSTDQPLLSDRFGAVIWQEHLGKGRVVFATTPDLAANAYQDYPGNYEFLAQLVTQDKHPVWVDEYIHGYKSAPVLAQETPQSWGVYLAQTAIFPVFCQGVILLLVLIWGRNHRLGPPLIPAAPVVDNSKAYIEALAQVLHKAGSSEFILDTVGKAEQLQVQARLGLGQTLLKPQTLVAAWAKTGRPVAELQQMLRLPAAKHRISEADLLAWLGNLETVRRRLPS